MVRHLSSIHLLLQLHHLIQMQIKTPSTSVDRAKMFKSLTFSLPAGSVLMLLIMLSTTVAMVTCFRATEQ